MAVRCGMIRISYQLFWKGRLFCRMLLHPFIGRPSRAPEAQTAMILHGDLDAFYAAVAQRDDPSLRGKPLVVSGRSRRAVVLTASYEARPFGVRSAMPLFMALQKCPQLVIVPPDFTKYREASRAMFGILRLESSVVEGLSLDEAFCDLGERSLDESRAV